MQLLPLAQNFGFARRDLDGTIAGVRVTQISGVSLDLPHLSANRFDVLKTRLQLQASADSSTRLEEVLVFARERADRRRVAAKLVRQRVFFFEDTSDAIASIVEKLQNKMLLSARAKFELL